MSHFNVNKPQEIAINHISGPMMVLAGPGSGKTTVILHRVLNLLKNNINPSEILVITFTKATAEEMKHRFARLNNENHNITFCTFHSFFFRILRDYNKYGVDILLSSDDRKKIIGGLISHFGVAEDEDTQENIESEISLIKNEMLDIQYYNSKHIGHEDFRRIYKNYEEQKEEIGKIDFDDMLWKCYELVSTKKQVLERWQNKYKHILIDEFQDINKSQYETIKLLASKYKNLFIVGDDDQSIYKFRGARPEFLLSFKEDYEDTKVTILNTNYRSTDQIIGFSNKVIAKNTTRYEKTIIGTDKNGIKPVLGISEDSNKEARNIVKKIIMLSKSIPLDDIAVIYRTGQQARAIIDAFIDFRVPFNVKDVGQSIYSHRVAKDIFAYLLLAENENDNKSLIRIINKPSRFISNKEISKAKEHSKYIIEGLLKSDVLSTQKVQRIGEIKFYLGAIKKRNTYDAIKYIRQAVGYDQYLKEYCKFKNIKIDGLMEVLLEVHEASKAYNTINEFMEHVDSVLERGTKPNKIDQDGVVLTTMHSSKGLEFNTVFVASACDELIPHYKSRTDAEIEEERRLFYVAITRAKERLYISSIENRYDRSVEVTPFLKGIID